MIGDALSWIRGLWCNKLLTTWAWFIDDLQELFGAADFENKLEDLSQLQQSSTMASYLEKFEELFNEVDGQFEQTLITYFMGRLRADIKSELNILRPGMLRQAFAATMVYEAHPGRCQPMWWGPPQLIHGESNSLALLKTPPDAT